MAAPPPKKSKESNTISMVVQRWYRGQVEQYSAVRHINGYPWRLRLVNNSCFRNVELCCEKSTEPEYELWECTATMKLNTEKYNRRIKPPTHTFKSWDEKSHKGKVAEFTGGVIKSAGTLLEVEVEINEHGENHRRHPHLSPLEPRDGILVFGEEKKKIRVNKKSLASQSSYFDRLFFGDFKEKNMTEIPIGDVEYEEFNNILKMVYRSAGVSFTDESIHRILELADRFDLKIVEDCTFNYFLSSLSSLTVHEKLLFSEQNNIPFLKERVISQYTGTLLKELIKSPVWDQLSKDTVTALMEKSCALIDKVKKAFHSFETQDVSDSDDLLYYASDDDLSDEPYH